MIKYSFCLWILLLVLVGCNFLNIDDVEVNPSDCPIITKAYYKDACLEEIVLEGENFFENTHRIKLKSKNNLDSIEDKGTDEVELIDGKLHIKVDSEVKWEKININYFNPCRATDPIYYPIIPQFKLIESSTSVVPINKPSGIAIDASQTSPHLYISSTSLKSVFLFKETTNDLQLIAGSSVDSKTFNEKCEFAILGRFDKPGALTINPNSKEFYLLDCGNYTVRRISDLDLASPRIHNMAGTRVFRPYSSYADISDGISSCAIKLSLDDHASIATTKDIVYFAEQAPNMIRYINFSTLCECGVASGCYCEVVGKNTENDQATVYKLDSFKNTITALAASIDGKLLVGFETERYILDYFSNRKIEIPIEFEPPIRDILIGENEDVFFIAKDKIGYFSLKDNSEKIAIKQLLENCDGNPRTIDGNPSQFALYEGDNQKILYITRKLKNDLYKIVIR